MGGRYIEVSCVSVCAYMFMCMHVLVEVVMYVSRLFRVYAAEHVTIDGCLAGEAYHRE